MPIFISYNYQDKDFAHSLARNLVTARHSIWIDTWEINAGDSLIDKIQNALGGGDAILVILSQNSVASEWCKKELNTGLVRELEEKKVLLIPCVIDDCSIPLFLKEKLYVDFRIDPDNAFDLLDRSLSSISNPVQSRIEGNDYHTDWSIDWGDVQGSPIVEWLFVDHGPSVPYSIVTRCRMTFDGAKATRLYQEELKKDQHIRYASELLEKYLEEEKSGEYRVLIENANEITDTVRFEGKSGEKIIVFTSVRRLGLDNGMDTLFNVDNILRMSIQHYTAAIRSG